MVRICAGIYQLENHNVVKENLKNLKYRNDLIEVLQQVMVQESRYKNIALITYMHVDGIDGVVRNTENTFAKWLARKLGVNLYAHFGNLRGLNKFEDADLDLLLIVGRHSIYRYIRDYFYATFGNHITLSQPEGDGVPDKAYFDPDTAFGGKGKYQYFDKIIRMKDGRAMSLNSVGFYDNRVENVNHHWSRAETIQAVGRIRPLEATKPQDVYLFSNESLGTDIEITGFFRKWGEQKEDTKYDDAIVVLKEKGFCRNKNEYLKEYLGMNSTQVREDKPRMKQSFLSAGMIEREYEVKSNTAKSGYQPIWTYFIWEETFDINNLMAELESEDYILVGEVDS